jgi:hypothetical protein
MWPSAVEEPPRIAGIRISSADSRKNSHIRKNRRASPHRRGRDTSMLLSAGFYTTKTQSGLGYQSDAARIPALLQINKQRYPTGTVISLAC